MAQRAEAPELLFRWQWETGRLLADGGEVVPAVVSYRRALESLTTVRNDLALGFGNELLDDTTAADAFRLRVGDLYFELADLLLRQATDAAAAGDAAREQALLVEARATVEQLKTAELEDYFQDKCRNIDAAAPAGIDAKTCVLYVIPLPDRTEILLGFGDGLKRVTSPATRADLDAQVDKFRRGLVRRIAHTYRRPAAKLYDWLIRPIEAELQSRGIDTIVFVPDGKLRTVPMAALMDGDTFLIERHAVAVSPGLSLMRPRHLERENVRITTAALSVKRLNYPAPPHVKQEVETIAALFEGASLVDDQFVEARIDEELAGSGYGIVHVASHGEFGPTADQTFLLTYDGTLDTAELERLLRPGEYRGKPVELRTLSACQTAVGDDRAALGQADVAIKGGARSALATLWFVNAAASSALVGDFYRVLHDEPTFTKAQALRQAQVTLLRDPAYRHPCYWSPYLLIGNWL